MQFTVDGQPQSIRRSKRARSQTYTVSLTNREEEAAASAASSAREVTIAYTYKVLVRQQGQLLYLNLGGLTRGLKISLRYGGCGIHEINTLDFIASAKPVRLAQTPASVPTPAVEVSFDGWVLRQPEWCLRGS